MSIQTITVVSGAYYTEEFIEHAGECIEKLYGKCYTYICSIEDGAEGVCAVVSSISLDPNNIVGSIERLEEAGASVMVTKTAYYWTDLRTITHRPDWE